MERFNDHVPMLVRYHLEDDVIIQFPVQVRAEKDKATYPVATMFSFLQMCDDSQLLESLMPAFKSQSVGYQSNKKLLRHYQHSKNQPNS